MRWGLAELHLLGCSGGAACHTSPPHVRSEHRGIVEPSFVAKDTKIVLAPRTCGVHVASQHVSYLKTVEAQKGR